MTQLTAGQPSLGPGDLHAEPMEPVVKSRKRNADSLAPPEQRTDHGLVRFETTVATRWRPLAIASATRATGRCER